MTITFGTNRFDYPNPDGITQTARAAERAGFRQLWFPDSQLRNGDVFLSVDCANGLDKKHDAQ